MEEIILWPIAEQRCQRRLRVDIDTEHPVSLERQPLRRVHRGRGFARAALEVEKGQNLKLVAGTATAQIGALGLGWLFECRTHVLDVGGGVMPATARCGMHIRNPAVEMELAQERG